MQDLIQKFEKPLLANKFPDIHIGDAIEFTYKFKDEEKDRSQKVQGLVIAKKHGKGLNGTITVRSIIENMGVERIFPIHSPFISDLSITARYKVRRAKLYYIRNLTGKAARLKRIDQRQATNN